MKKLLIVSDLSAVAKALVLVLESLAKEVQVQIASTTDAVPTLQEFEPTHILITGYDENEGRTVLSWHELQGYLTSSQKMARMGWHSYSHPDYIRLPQSISGILRFLELEVPPVILEREKM
jgi:hypothetical protein